MSSRAVTRRLVRARGVCSPKPGRLAGRAPAGGGALVLDQHGVQHLGAEPVQHQAEAGAQRRQRHPRVAVVDQRQVRGVAQDLRRVDADGLVELQRLVRAREVALPEQQVIERRVELDRRDRVEEVERAARKPPERDGRLVDGVEVDARRRRQAAALGGERGVQADDEVVEVQIVLQEQVVLDVGGFQRPQRRRRDARRPSSRPGTRPRSTPGGSGAGSGSSPAG